MIREGAWPTKVGLEGVPGSWAEECWLLGGQALTRGDSSSNSIQRFMKPHPTACLPELHEETSVSVSTCTQTERRDQRKGRNDNCHEKGC